MFLALGNVKVEVTPLPGDNLMKELLFIKEIPVIEAGTVFIKLSFSETLSAALEETLATPSVAFVPIIFKAELPTRDLGIVIVPPFNLTPPHVPKLRFSFESFEVKV